jgi:hypothetical protein
MPESTSGASKNARKIPITEKISGERKRSGKETHPSIGAIIEKCTPNTPKAIAKNREFETGGALKVSKKSTRHILQRATR